MSHLLAGIALGAVLMLLVIVWAVRHYRIEYVLFNDHCVEHDGRTKPILCDKCGKECLPFSGHRCQS